MLLHEPAEKTSKWINGWYIEVLLVMPLLFVLLVFSAYELDPDAVRGVLAMLVALSPIWLPIGLFTSFWVSWMHYIRFIFWRNTDMVLLEIQLPPEVAKSPLSMELFLTALYQTGGETTFIQRIWKGQYRPVWSLEIAGDEGRIGFYLHLRRAFQKVIEARLYGQFPEAKIIEVEDYTGKIHFNLEEYDLWGCEYDKGDIEMLPIKTYVDYGLDKNPDTPEVQVDPITNILEFIGSAGPGEHIWMQIIAKGRKKDEWYGFYYTAEHYKDAAKKKIKEITETAIKRAQEFAKDESAKAQAAARATTLLTDGERRQIDAIERGLTKNLFECGLRVLYLAKKEKFYGPNIPKVVTFFHSFRYPGYNSLGSSRGLSDFNYPWQDWNNIRQNKVKRNLFRHYQERAYFYVPYEQQPVVLTTEELATLWHFPSSVVKTPGLTRVSSRRADAPPNLPVLPS
jgi:hypothetical protein